MLCFGLGLTLLTQGVRVHLNEVKRAERSLNNCSLSAIIILTCN